LKGFPVDDRTEEQVVADFEAFVRVLGPVTLHGESKAPIWKITPRASLDHVPTFSETASEAPLHTDNSWVSAPETYFSLLVLRPASDGGNSILLSIDELKREFASTEPGPEAIRILTEHQFPFAMPAIFRGGSDPAEVVTSPVFGSPLGFRFRHDVILAGFEARPALATVESVWAVEAFNAFLLEVLADTQGMRLERGDVVLANNHRVLHARTHFTDPHRLLLRARMIEGAVESGRRLVPIEPSASEGQLVPSSVDLARYRRDEAALLDALSGEGLDVSLYDSAFNPYPFAVPRERLAELRALQDALRRALIAVVTHFSSDRRLGEVIRLEAAEREIVDGLSALPYRPGSFRPDFVHGADGRVRVTEINARFPLNGYLSSSVLNRVLPRLHDGVRSLPGLVTLEQRLRERLGERGCVGILRASEPGWDIHFLRAWWHDGSDLVLPETATRAQLERWTSVVLELRQHEIAHAVPPEARHALARHPGLLNDLRTIFVGHDKRLLALFSTSPVLEDYLEADDVARLRRHVVPTWVKGLAPGIVADAREAARGWIAKPPRSGKGRGILVAHHLSPEAWRTALSTLPDDWILQPYIDQATFPILVRRDDRIVTQRMKVVGLLPSLDEHSFGPGMYRAADDDIVNVARGGTILIPTLATEGNRE
jgi:hypothetical protein